MSALVIPPVLLRQLKKRAKREGKTLEQLLDEIITRALDEEMRWS